MQALRLFRVPVAHTRFFLLLGSLLTMVPASHSQVVFGQIDAFEGGTTANWANGNNATDPIVVAGGPLGVGDHFLQVSADGVGPGGKLTMWNRSQWTGDFNSAGVTHIDMDLKGFSSPGSADLSIRIAFKSGTTSSSPGYVSTTAFALPIDGQWHHASFDLSAMTAANGTPPPLSTLLNNAPEMRILDAALPNTVHGDVILAQFGVDNITATVPEPASTAGVAILLAAYTFHRRARRSQ